MGGGLLWELISVVKEIGWGCVGAVDYFLMAICYVSEMVLVAEGMLQFSAFSTLSTKHPHKKQSNSNPHSFILSPFTIITTPHDQ